MIINEDGKVNKEGWLWLAPEYFNRWRMFPRAFIIFYFWLAFETAMWFMGLPAPGPSQAAFASAVIGAGAAWFGLYVNSGSMSVRSTPQPGYEYRRTTRIEPQPTPNNQSVPDEISPPGTPTYEIKGE